MLNSQVCADMPLRNYSLGVQPVTWAVYLGDFVTDTQPSTVGIHPAVLCALVRNVIARPRRPALRMI